MKLRYIALLLIPCILSAQEEKQVPLNLLHSKSLSAFSLMGIESAVIERPGNISDLTLALVRQTDSFQSFPGDFGLELSPFWLFAGKKITYDSYAEAGRLSTVIPQTLTVSVAMSGRTGEDGEAGIVSVGTGVRLSLLRGSIDPEFAKHRENMDSLMQILGVLNDVIMDEWSRRINDDEEIETLLNSLAEADPAIRDVIEPAITAQIAAREREIRTEVERELRTEYSNETERVRRIVSEIRVRRIGWKLDLAGGLSAQFPDRKFDDSAIDRWGFWVSGGYEWSGAALIGIVRVLDTRTGSTAFHEGRELDGGLRLFIDAGEKFGLSVEGLYRTGINNGNSRTDWRGTLSADYMIARNMLLSFTFGKDFADRLDRDLLALINISFGFGTDRPVISP